MIFKRKITPWSMDIKSELVRRFENSNTYTMAVLEKIPDDALAYKPSKNTRSFAEIFQHIAEAQLYTASQAIAINTLKFEGRLNNKKELTLFLNQSNDLLINTVKSLSIDELMRTVRFWDGKSSKLKILYFTLDHITHHRAQIALYLRIKGIKPPKYIGW